MLRRKEVTLGRKKSGVDYATILTWYSSTDNTLVEVQAFHAGTHGPAAMCMIIPSVACHTTEEIDELREAVIAACDAAEKHLAESAGEPTDD